MAEKKLANESNNKSEEMNKTTPKLCKKKAIIKMGTFLFSAITPNTKDTIPRVATRTDICFMVTAIAQTEIQSCPIITKQ